MQLTRVLAIAQRQFYLFSGSPARMLSLVAWVAIDMILWGFITRYLNSVSQAGFDFVPAMLGAVLLWDFLVRVMFGVTMAFMEDIWSRNFLNFFASPLTIVEYLCGLVITSISTSCIGLVVMLLLATTVFGLSFFAYGLMLIPFLLVLFLFGITLGIIGSAIMLRFGPAAEWFIWPLPALLSPFAGVFYPLSTLPVWMQWLARLLPASYVFEGMRGIVLDQRAHGSLLLIGAALACTYLALSAWGFTHVYRHALRTGLIARYSAENAG